MRVAWIVRALLLLTAWPMAAQLRLGETSSKLSGTVSSGYTADFGNMTSSDHGWTVGGAATFDGSFHSPNFLSYNISPYLNQSRANSNFQSISNASGVNVTGNIFAGSRFPGSLSYSKAYNSEGNFAVPGLANFVTHGNNDAFGINWSENLPDVPSFSAGYQLGSGKYSVYGTNNEGDNTFHSLNLRSSYRMAGFNMGAYYTLGGGHSLIPQVVSGQQNSETHSDSSAEGVNVTHLLPLQGSASAGFNRSTWNTDYLGYSSNGIIDTVNAVASIRPARTVSLMASANYSDNLNGQLLQAIVAAGGVAPDSNSNQSSSSLDLLAVASYTPLPNLQTSGSVERRTQSFLGQDYGVISYGGSASYAHKLRSGNFNAAMNITANKADNTGEDTLGYSTNANYSNQILGWNITGSFGYAQNVQTLLVTYMNSFYNFSGNARRRWGKFNLSMGAGGARTALTEQSGTASSSQSYSAGIGYGTLFTATGSYSKAEGQALATGAGLVPVPVPSPVLPPSLVSLYGGDSYSVGLSSSPVKRLVLTAAYAKSISNISSDAITFSNQDNQFNSLVQYQFRKMGFNSGYSRLQQGFSSSGTKPEVISSYYFGVTRWFNFF